MEVILYKNKSDSKYVVKDIQSVSQIFAILKDGCSRSNPIIRIQFTSMEDMKQKLTVTNYIYISDFKRYYFVEDWIYMNNFIAEVRLRVDVLMSFYPLLVNNTVWVDRNEFDYNIDLIDDLYPTEFSKTIINAGVYGYYVPTSVDSIHGFKVTSATWNYDYSYVISTVGKEDQEVYNNMASNINNFNNIYVTSANEVDQILDSFFTESFITSLKQGFTNPSEYFNSIKLYPFSVSTITGISLTARRPVFDTKRVGVVDEEVAFRVNNESRPTMVYGAFVNNEDPRPIDISHYLGNGFLSASPFTTAELYIPYVGFINIDVKLLREPFYIVVPIDLSTGDCDVIITDINPYIEEYTDTYGNFIRVWRRYPRNIPSENIRACFSINVSISVPVGQTNRTNQNLNKLTAGVTAAAGIITGGAGLLVAGGAAASVLANPSSYKKSGDLTKKATAAYAGAQAADTESQHRAMVKFAQSSLATTTNTVTSLLNNIPHISRGSQKGSVAGLMNGGYFHIKLTKMKDVLDTEDKKKEFRHLRGSPLCAIRRLGDLKGFTVITDLVLHNNSDTTILPAEIDELKSMLSDGVYFPDP